MFTKSIGDGEWEGMLINVGLCAGRHDIEGITDYTWVSFNDSSILFNEPIENPNDFITLRQIANKKLEEMWYDGNCINIYVTGLSQALTIVLSEIYSLHQVTDEKLLIQVFHWDRETETYKGHTIID